MTDVTLPPRILVVEDDPGVRALLSEAFRIWRSAVPVELCDNVSDVHAAVPGRCSLILLDGEMQRQSSYRLLKNLRRNGPLVPVLFMTRKRRIPSGFSKLGDIRLLRKPFGVGDLKSILETVLPPPVEPGPTGSSFLEDLSARMDPPIDQKVTILPTGPVGSSAAIPRGSNGAGRVDDVPIVRGTRPAEESEQKAPAEWLEGYLLGRHPTMQEVRKAILTYAPGKLPMLVLGAPGTGKELVARAIHRCSRRHQSRFQVAHCSALAETLLESELFGHVKGAFTGALARRAGRFAQADGGSLFLDEVGDMSISTQTKLLRATEYGEISPVGSDETFHVDARLISATHQDVEKLIREGRFRPDFLARIFGVVIRLPRLVEHREDIPLYTRHFLMLHAAAKGEDPKDPHPGALDVLVNQSWPGNVRQLKTVLERAAEQVAGGTISADDLLESLKMGILPGGQQVEYRLTPKGEGEKHLMVHALAETRGIVVHAARKIRMSHSSFYRKMAKYGIRPSRG